MKPINTKFNLHDSLEKMDEILKSDDVIMKRESFTPEDAKGARGSIIDASFVSVRFFPEAELSNVAEKWAAAGDILLSQMYKLVASQPRLLNLEWDGCRLHAIFNTTHKEHIDALLDSVGMIISLTDVINYKIKDTGWSFKVNAGIDYGKVLSVPIDGDTTLWKIDGILVLDKMLEDINVKRLIISKFIHNNLKEGYQTLFKGLEPFGSKYYQADIVNIGINNWLKEHKGKS